MVYYTEEDHAEEVNSYMEMAEFQLLTAVIEEIEKFSGFAETLESEDWEVNQIFKVLLTHLKLKFKEIL